MTPLAIDGGAPVRSSPLPYARPLVDDDDILAVTAVLRSDWLTTGPAVSSFERALAATVGATHAVAVNSGTAALHAAMFALGVGEGDEVLVPAITFVASANCAVYQGARPVFVDVDPDTLLIDPDDVARKLTAKTRVVVGVDYAGQPCDWRALRSVVAGGRASLVADACHSLGGATADGRVGLLADISAFSFHPVKHVTTGEGGAITTSNETYDQIARTFRNHGISTDHRERERRGTFAYEMTALGYNYRLSDLHAALGESQLRHLDAWIARRQAIAARYDAALADVAAVSPLRTRAGALHARHLYVVRLDLERLTVDRARVHAAMRAENILANVHYSPVHLHPFYRERFGTGPGMCLRAEAVAERILSLPMFPAMTDADVDDTVAALSKILAAYKR